MNRVQTMLIVGVCLLMAPSSSFPAANALPGQDRPLKGAYKASDLVGKYVKNLQGEDLGQLEDVVIESTGKVGYAVLTFGGFLGMGDKLFAVPWNALAHSPEGDHLTLDIQPEKLEQAPGFKRDDWPDMDDEDWRRAINEFYQAAGDQAAAPGHQRKSRE